MGQERDCSYYFCVHPVVCEVERHDDNFTGAVKMADAVERRETIGQRFDLILGDRPISEAVSRAMEQLQSRTLLAVTSMPREAP